MPPLGVAFPAYKPRLRDEQQVEPSVLDLPLAELPVFRTETLAVHVSYPKAGSCNRCARREQLIIGPRRTDRAPSPGRCSGGLHLALGLLCPAYLVGTR